MPRAKRESEANGGGGGPEPPSVNGHDRRVILARRARFIAATLAGVGFAPGCATQPRACLSQPMIEIDGGTEGPDDRGDAAPSVEPEPEPKVCLEIAEPPPPDAGPRKAPPPRICLSEY